MDSKSAFFNSRRDNYNSRYLKLKDKLKSLAFFRVLTFIAFLLIVTISANYSNLFGVIISTILFTLIFVILVKLFNNTQYLANHNKFLSGINSDEVLRAKGSLDEFDPGLEFAKAEHPYHNDLDIFGNNSLFQLINRCSTFWGRKTLADWLSAKASHEEILLRQESIKELSGDIDWIQKFQATGRHYENKADIGNFLKWLKSPQVISENFFYIITRYLGPVLMTLIIFLVIISVLSYHWIFLGIVLNSVILLTILDRVKNIHENTAEAIKSLRGMEALIILVEKKDFKSKNLKHYNQYILRISQKYPSVLAR